MYGKSKDVNKVLDKGRSWVTELEDAVSETKAKAEEKNEEIQKLTNERSELDSQVLEGSQVASNFKKLLEMK